MSKVTIVGAGNYGSLTAHRIAETDLADEVVMTDIVEGLPEGLALDMNQAAPLQGFRTHIVGQSDGYGKTAGSDVVVVTAGLPRKPGMSRMDLLETNGKIVADVTRKTIQESPDAVLIVVTNPLDEMTALAQQVAGLPPARVMGQAGMLDTARLKTFIAWELDVAPSDVEGFTLGSHGDTMVPVPSLCRVQGKPLVDLVPQDVIDAILQRTRDGGAEIVGLLKKGSAYFAPSSAAAAMARAVLLDTKEQMPVCAWVEGQYGIEGIYLGVPAIIGASGVEGIVEVDLTDAELAALRQAADAIRSKQADVMGMADAL